MARIMTEPLTLTRVGEHWMDGGLYQDEQGRYYVDHFSAVAHGKVNSVDILCPSDDPDGEPDYTLTGIIVLTNPPSEREKLCKAHDFDLMMLGRLKFDLGGFFSEGDCRYHRPDCLWAGNVKGQVAELRKFYAKLPDDIKDASPVTYAEIVDYDNKLEAWAVEEFSKPEYDPVPATPYDIYHGLEIMVGDFLHYDDDEGKTHTPTHVWFSSDTRRWHKDANENHGRAFTTYLSKKGGTVLTPVWMWGRNNCREQYVRKDLCDVSCKYDNTILKWRLYDFYHE